MMGIKDTDDYLTVRFANPETGQVSPSICGGRTPRTPLTPGEALRLYGSQSTGSPPCSGIGRKRLDHTNGDRADSEWQGHGEQSFTAAYTAMAMPGARNHPMPALRRQQAYKLTTALHANAQNPALLLPDSHAARSRATRARPHVQPPPWMRPIVEEGPQRFAQASEALKMYSNSNRLPPTTMTSGCTQPRARHRSATSSCPVPDKELPDVTEPSPSPQSSYTVSDISLAASDGLHYTLHSNDRAIWKGTHPHADANIRVPRKPVGSPPCRRTPTALDQSQSLDQAKGTLSSIKDSSSHKTGLRDGPAKFLGSVGARGESRSPPDFQQTAGARDGIPQHHDSVASLPLDPTAMAATRLHIELPSALSISPLLTFFGVSTAEKETQQGFLNPIGIRQALDTLRRPDMPPSERFIALRFLLTVFGRTVIALTVTLALLRVLAAIKELFDILLWPVKIVGGVLRFIFI